MLAKIHIFILLFLPFVAFSQAANSNIGSNETNLKWIFIAFGLAVFLCFILILYILKLRKNQKDSTFTNYILNNGNSIIISSNKKGKITYISENVNEILGYKASELLGNGWWEKTIDDKTELENEKEKIIEKFNSEEITTRLIRTKNGKYKWIQWHDKKFNEELIVGIGQDITSLKELEFENKKQQELALLRQSTINTINKLQYDNTKSINEFIKIILKEASKAIDVDVFSLLDYNEGKLKILSLFNTGTNSFNEGEELVEDDYPHYFETLKTGRIIKVENVLENEFTKEFNTGYFEKNGIKSLIDLPIFINGQLKLVISCETIINHKSWSDEDVRFLKSISDIILITLENEKRKQAEILVTESENNFRQINETIESVFWLYDQVENRVVYISPSCEKILGAKQEQFYKTNDYWKYYILEEDKEQITTKHEDLHTKGQYEVEYRILKEKEIRWIKEKSYAVQNIKGKVVKNSGICTDITEEKRIQEKIKQLSLVAEKTTNAVSISDANGIVMWVNQGYLDLFEIDSNQIIGKKPRDLFLKNDSSLSQKITQVNGTNYKIELQVNTKKNNVIWVELNNTVIIDENGEVEQQVEVITDITTHILNEKKIESQSLILEEYAKDLEYQNKLKEKLLHAEDIADVTYNALHFVNEQIDNILHLSMLFPDYYEQIFSGLALENDAFVNEEYFVHELNCYAKCKEGEIYIVENIELVKDKSSSDIKYLNADMKSYIVLPLMYQKNFLGILLVSFKETLKLNYKQITYLKDACTVISVTINQLKLKDALKLKNDDILSSIIYAKNIQSSILPDIKNFSANFQNVALYYRPKDIVSGDFYWSKDTKDFSYLAIGDCTGHGVPGAFLTLLGLNLLEQLVSIEKRTSPAEIISLLDSRLFTILNQNTSDNVIKDGMELGLCIYDKNNKKLLFAGAGLGILYFQNGEEIHVRGQRTTIGEIQHPDFVFENSEVQIKGDEYFFMATDGYQDQLGGEKYKRFSKNRLIILLNEIKEKEASVQESILGTTIDAYIGENSQLDDYTVIGFKIINS
ncbi:MAG: PAS domain S-box protein [Flavobacteriia bacterium]